MRALLVLILGLGSVVAAASASATVYVPGQYKDGIYIRPHFLDFPGQAVGGALLLPPGAEVAKDEKVSAPAVLEPRPALPRSRPLPAS
jgi:hypothetical protein